MPTAKQKKAQDAFKKKTDEAKALVKKSGGKIGYHAAMKKVYGK